MDESRSEIQSFYKDKIIFITGASGFMGKVLMEKLLYSCSDLSKIYILMRDKKGRSWENRFKDMFNIPLFRRLHEQKPQIFKKVIPLNGDILSDNLGLTTVQRECLIQEVNVVFHLAASLRMEAKMKDSIKMNTMSTHTVLKLAKQMKHLQVFVHLSTAYCHVDQDELGEHIYDSPHDPHDIMRLVEWLDEEAIDFITPKLLGSHPNCYTYSKQLTETLVANEYPNLPCIIARPSIVCPILLEPVPGWVDTLNGIGGIIVGVGKGVIRSIHCTPTYYAEIIPVDIAINWLIVFSYMIGTSKIKSKSIPVYNITQGNVRPITWGEMLEKGRKIIYDYPFEGQVWYPDGAIRTNKYVHNLFVFFFHIIPAYLIDFLMLIFRQKRFMDRIQKRISVGLEVLQYFTTKNWKFCNDKGIAIANKQSPADQKLFPIAILHPDEDKYTMDIILGLRQYYMKEDLSTLPKARRHQKVMYGVHITTLYLFYFGIIYCIYNNCEIVKILVNYVIGKVQLLFRA
ncbi:putative fatty acyl-CoA reductase CG5065 isoform X2 [Pseudomyrmex gracilis]|uniref:putative fatty acyl-CoA reductase CG5065 isoform X2 n=1 Tax=Pseudomyrmex gracilis TaxID=219809 RepID=UPI000995768B|nr:putative fatty acyl-CoA reductase CG5065 isoform X2 [Pseudomyrmex gracilis]